MINYHRYLITFIDIDTGVKELAFRFTKKGSLDFIHILRGFGSHASILKLNSKVRP